MEQQIHDQHFLTFPENFNELGERESEQKRKIHNFIHISSLNFLRHATAALARVNYLQRQGKSADGEFCGTRWLAGACLKIEKCCEFIDFIRANHLK